MGTRCAIELLGGFRVTLEGVRVPQEAWRYRRGAELVKLLALARARRLLREQLMEALWPSLSPEAAGANLRKALLYARRALGGEATVRVDGGVVSLLPDHEVRIDATAFEEAAREALGSGGAAARARAIALYTGELLPEDRYAAWCEEARERLRLRFLEVLRAAGEWDRLLEVGRADEEAHRALMEAALARGDRNTVVRQFERLRDALRADLGVGPDAASIALYEKALAMEGHEPPTRAEQARALLARGLVHMHAGDLEEAERLAEHARAMAIEVAAGRELGEASALLGMIASAQGRWKLLFRSEFVASLRRPPDVAACVFDAHLCLAEFALYGTGGHEEIAPFVRELLALADEAGSAQGRAVAWLLLGEVELLSGRWRKPTSTCAGRCRCTRRRARTPDACSRSRVWPRRPRRAGSAGARGGCCAARWSARAHRGSRRT